MESGPENLLMRGRERVVSHATRSLNVPGARFGASRTSSHLSSSFTNLTQTPPAGERTSVFANYLARSHFTGSSSSNLKSPTWAIAVTKQRPGHFPRKIITRKRIFHDAPKASYGFPLVGGGMTMVPDAVAFICGEIEGEPTGTPLN